MSPGEWVTVNQPDDEPAIEVNVYGIAGGDVVEQPDQAEPNDDTDQPDQAP